MKLPKLINVLIAGSCVLASGGSATAALVTVSSTEIWDGTNNPHAADGVTLSGSGILGDPFIYTMPPEGMHVTSTGYIQLSTTNITDDFTVQFQFTGGNLQMDAGAVIDTQRPVRSGQQFFIMDLGNTIGNTAASITGAGSIIGLRGTNTGRAFAPHILQIQNANNVSLAKLDTHTENVGSGMGSSFNITVPGNITITGILDVSDHDLGGNNVPNVTLQASTLNLGPIDTRAFRNNAGSFSQSGSVTLQALQPDVYDPANVNTYSNRMVLNGLINTHGAGPTLGNITLQSVVLVLNNGFAIDKSPNGVLSVRVGNDTLGAPDKDLFINVAGAAITPTYDVNWDGVSPAGHAPSFTSHPIFGTSTSVNVPYNFTLTATDVDGGTLTYSKGSGPAWLSVAANGAVTGTPTQADSGTNVFQVAVSDGTRYDITTLFVKVGGPPKFNTNLVVKAKAVQDTPYSGQTLASDASDPDGDPMTFAKVSGPAWLNVAANGALSGTPTASDTFTNTWVVSVTDGTGTNTATLQILVGGAPKFLSATVLKSDGAVGINYGVGNQTLATSAVDPDNDPLTFSKLSGPAWLTVGANGALSGTPGAGDVGTNP